MTSIINCRCRVGTGPRAVFEAGDCVGVSLPGNRTDGLPGYPRFVGYNPEKVGCASTEATMMIISVGACSSYDTGLLGESYGTEDQLFELTIEGADETYCAEEV